MKKTPNRPMAERDRPVTQFVTQNKSQPPTRYMRQVYLDALKRWEEDKKRNWNNSDN